MVSDVVSNVFSLERSVFAAIFKLLINPKHIIHNYWKGNRKYYPSPGRVFFYALAVAALHLSYVNKEILGLSFEIGIFRAHFFFWAIFFPLLAISSYLVFLKHKYSMAQNAVSLLYLASAFYMLITIPYDLYNLVSGNQPIGANLFFLFAFALFSWNAVVFTKSGKPLMVALNAVLQILVFLAIIAAIVSLLYLFSPGSVRGSQ
jgi:hypothetical protein